MGGDQPVWVIPAFWTMPTSRLTRLVGMSVGYAPNGIDRRTVQETSVLAFWPFYGRGFSSCHIRLASTTGHSGAVME